MIQLSIIFVALITLLIYSFRRFYLVDILILRTNIELAIKTMTTILLIKSFRTIASLIRKTSYIKLSSISCEVRKESRSLGD